MGRLVSPVERGTMAMAGGGGGGDDYATRVAKYIPAEIVAGYVAVQNILPNAMADCHVPMWWWYLLYAFFVVITPAYLYRQRVRGQPYKLHLVIGTIAFVIWSYALTDCTKYGIFSAASYSPTAAAILLIVFSLSVGVFQPEPPA